MHSLERTIKAELTAFNLTQMDLAKALGVNISTVNRKLNGTSSFTIAELRTVATFLNLNFYELTALAEEREKRAQQQGKE
ncbi:MULTISPECIES: helix-turn-helix domain-containing protein [Actinomycetes]|uniref:helix-turn-helix domain-containing protein n=1 Tax=Actinomycetes TaxID=1760 RepID=UPI0003B6B043|nr:MULTISPECIES: helix-turn-helix transcriptional regulator [Actinomycetes]